MWKTERERISQKREKYERGRIDPLYGYEHYQVSSGGIHIAVILLLFVALGAVVLFFMFF